ncbi:ABC transporter permease [Planctomycetota bacterium]
MFFETHVGSRFFRKRIINLLAVAVVAFSVMMPIVVLAVMEGFANYMTSQIRGALSDIIVGSVQIDSTVSGPEEITQAIKDLDYVAGASPFIRNFVIARNTVNAGRIAEPALLQGINPELEYDLYRARGPAADLATAIYGCKDTSQLSRLMQREALVPNIGSVNRQIRFQGLPGDEAIGVLLKRLSGNPGLQKELRDIIRSEDLTWSDLVNGAEESFYTFVDLQALTPEKVFPVAEEEGFEDIHYPAAIVNIELARKLGILCGDGFTITAISKRGKPVKRRFRMSGALRPYSAAKGDRLDMPSIVIDFKEAQVIFGTEGNATGINVWLKQDFDLQIAAKDLQNRTYYDVLTWTYLRSNILRAVENENRLLRVVLLCIAVAAGIAILSIIYTSVSEKVKDIGILKAVGVTPGTIVNIFMVKTLIIGILGVSLGVVMAWLVVANINFLSTVVGWTPFSGDIYYLPADAGLPVSWEDAGVPLIAGVCFAVSLLAGLYPALRAASLNAVDAIHNE